jgi:hypothetical protein
MARRARAGRILAMTPTPASRLVLIPDARQVEAAPRAKRYRIARLALNPEASAGHDHLKRIYD